MNTHRRRSAPHTRQLRIESLEKRRLLAVVTVNSLDDAPANSNDGNLTLREAIRIISRDYEPPTIAGDGNDDAEQVDDFSTLGTNDRIVFGLEKSAYGDDLSATINLLATEEFGSALIIENSVVIEAPEAFEIEVSANGLNARAPCSSALINR